jgi:hypothetical protein
LERVIVFYASYRIRATSFTGEKKIMDCHHLIWALQQCAHESCAGRRVGHDLISANSTPQNNRDLFTQAGADSDESRPSDNPETFVSFSSAETAAQGRLIRRLQWPPRPGRRRMRGNGSRKCIGSTRCQLESGEALTPAVGLRNSVWTTGISRR